MTAIDSSNLQMCIPGNLNETWVTCMSDSGATVTKNFEFMLSRGSYEPTIISQKRQVSHGNLELEINPAYATSVVYM